MTATTTFAAVSVLLCSLCDLVVAVVALAGAGFIALFRVTIAAVAGAVLNGLFAGAVITGAVSVAIPGITIGAFARAVFYGTFAVAFTVITVTFGSYRTCKNQSQGYQNKVFHNYSLHLDAQG